MQLRIQAPRASILLACLAPALIAACGKPADPVVQAGAQKLPVPGIAEVKDIAERAFIYGLPIVMNHAVTNEFVVDRNSGQYKAPFNTISNEARVCA
jgi:hypothetical protein